jgi:hypothetical protein
VEPRRKRPGSERRPSTGITEPVYEPAEPWETQVARTIAGGVRSEGVARRASIVLLVLLLLPIALIAVGWVISVL